MRHFVVALISLALIGCGAEYSTVHIQQSAPEEASEQATSEPAVDEAAEDEVFVIDVRSKEEWDGGHVETAFHIPHTEIGDRIGEVTDNKDAKIVLYCAVGGRAGKAKTSLEEMGFTNVENGGGFDDVKERF